MKKFKLGIFAAIMISLLAGVVAMAGIKDDLTDRNEPSPGQITHIIGGIGPYGGKVANLDISEKHGLEVKTKDEPDAMTWDAAILAVKRHGEGWRLPTILELSMIYGQRGLIGGFSDEDYWSSTEQDINSAWIQGFRLGDQDRYNKQSRLKVRAVRSF